MRPTPGELISGVRRILRDVIEPDLNSEYAKMRLHDLRAVLAQVDWDNAGLLLQRQTTALNELLSECRDWMRSDSRRATSFAEQLTVLDTALEDDRNHNEEDYAAWNKRHELYDATVVALIEPIEGWIRSHPDDTRGDKLRGRLFDHYVR